MAVASRAARGWSSFSVLYGVLSLCGCLLSVLLFFPGIMSSDTSDVLHQAISGVWSDWHSPFYTFVFSLLWPAKFGPAAMLLLNCTLLWLAIYFLADSSRRRFGWISLVFFAVPFFPALVYMPGFIWDISLHSVVWLLAFAVIYRSVQVRGEISTAASVVAIALVVAGVLVRQNGWFASLPLVFMALPSTLNPKKRGALVCLVFLTLPLIWSAFGRIAHATQSHAAHSIITYDLGAMSAIEGRNLYPGVWSPPQSQSITGECFERDAKARANDNGWDIYSWGRCAFVTEALNGQHIFGTATLVRAWVHAILSNPAAYLGARANFFETFMLSRNSLPIVSSGLSNDQAGYPMLHPDRLAGLATAIGKFRNSPIFSPLTWFCVAMILAGLTLFLARMSSGVRRLGLPLAFSSLIWMLTYVPFGVAYDFRYVFWAVLASLVCAIVMICELIRSRRKLSR
ncbi:hypothetical protein [Paraburkholderia sp. J63]|uniref:hypothetical protein n=1 Tax=Paraburkholderia sp. J63 TaxID=2805434 RepID=UPI002ABD29C9|nr:hypothetical protein [Paraburkholderia sp. J63]